MRDWRRIQIGCKDKRLSLESWSSNPWSIVRYYKKVCVKISMNEFVMYGIVQEGHLPSLKAQVFLSGLWEDWQVYLPLSSQSSSLLNVCRPVGFRFRLQQKSFVMMKSQSFLSIFHFEGTEGPLWCCRKIPAVFEWIWWICFVAMIVFCRCQTALCSALMIGGATLYVKWTPMSFRKSFEEKFVYVLKIYPSKYMYVEPETLSLKCPLFQVRRKCLFRSIHWRFLISALMRASAKKCQTSFGGICEKVPLNPFYLLWYLKTICPHSLMSPAGPLLPLLPRIESGGARHRLLKKKAIWPEEEVGGFAEGGGSHAGQSKWQTAVKSVLWAPTYMWSRLTCELSQLPLVFR